MYYKWQQNIFFNFTIHFWQCHCTFLAFFFSDLEKFSIQCLVALIPIFPFFLWWFSDTSVMRVCLHFVAVIIDFVLWHIWGNKGDWTGSCKPACSLVLSHNFYISYNFKHLKFPWVENNLKDTEIMSFIILGLGRASNSDHYLFSQ